MSALSVGKKVRIAYLVESDALARRALRVMQDEFVARRDHVFRGEKVDKPPLDPVCDAGLTWKA